MRQQPSSLSKITQQEGSFDEHPGDADVGKAAVSQIGIKCFRSCGTEEYRTNNQQRIGMLDKYYHCIVGAECAEDRRVTANVPESDDPHHGKPDQHNRAEDAADDGGAKPLEEKEHDNDD